MKKNICLILTVIMMVSIVFPSAVVFAEGDVSAAVDKLPAFPGAEGGGMWTTGARGGENIEVYHVTTLEDDYYNVKKGMLRDAVSQSNRIIVFDVAGNIELDNALSIVGDNLTILGQTAPGDGICIKDNTVSVYGDNVIIRYLRFRMGDASTVEDDSFGGRGLKDTIIDHCSISWSTDECASFYENTNFTMQWCIIAESLKHSVHAKESHGYGGIWGGTNASFHHNLLAHHDSRNPRIDMGPITGADYDMSTQIELTDLRNNVIYNWGGNSAYGGQAGAPVNIINSYYKYGPSTNSHKSRIYERSSSGNNVSYVWSTDLYVDGNYMDGSSTVTNDNTKGVDKDSGVQKSYVWTKSSISENADAQSVHFKYENDYPVTTQTAEEAYNSVLESAGASVARDSADERVISDVKNRTGKMITCEYIDKNGEKATDTTYGIINSPSDVGGYPILTGTKAKDSDNDGIPNEWEDEHGLNKLDESDGLNLAPSGYTYLEEYANELASGAYVRDVNYDPNVPDYDPGDTPEPSSEPSTSAKPEIEFVSEWKPSSNDLNKENLELMPGLTNVIHFDKELTNEVKFADGTSYSYAISRHDGSGINGGWDAQNGKSKGTGLKYTAPYDGIFTLYGYSVTGEKKFYIVPEGVNIDPKTDPEAFEKEAVYVQNCIGSSVPVFCEVELKAGQTYYIYLDGSKARFCYVKFERYVEDKLPYEFTKAELDSSGKLSVEFNQNDTSVTDGKLIVAGFTSENILKDVDTYVIENGSVNDLDYIKPADIDHVNLYIWNDENSIVPLSLSVQNLK